MPISQGTAGGLPGLQLKAWALVRKNGGGVVKHFNVAGMVPDNSNGKQAWTFAQPMGGTEYMVRFTATDESTQSAMVYGSFDGAVARTAAGCGTITRAGVNVYQGGGLWEFYE